MGGKQEQLRQLLTSAIIDLCRQQTFYVEELSVQGTICLVSDRASVIVAHITEFIGVKKDTNSEDDHGESVSSKDHGGHSGLVLESSNSEPSGNRGMGSSTKSLLPSERTEGKYQCPFCPKSYQFKHSLKEHINKHTGKRPHVCKYCAHSFIHIASLSAHIKRRHQSHMPREFQCRVCDDLFHNEQSLRQHHTWRHKSLSFSELHPGSLAKKRKMSASVDELDTGAIADELDPRQARVKDEADDDRTIDDIQQGVNSSDEALLDEAESVPPVYVNHDDTISQLRKQFQADGNKFARGELSSHKKNADTLEIEDRSVVEVAPPGIASAETPMEFSIADLQRSSDGRFWCPYCDKSYNFKHTLKDHLNKHTGRRPHACKHCGDAFGHFASLCAHIKRRHEDTLPQDHQCVICQEKFLNEQSLKQHFTWRHKVKAEKEPKNLGFSSMPSINPVEKSDPHASPPQVKSPRDVNALPGQSPAAAFGIPHPSGDDILPSMEAFMKGLTMTLPLSAGFPENTVLPAGIGQGEIPGTAPHPTQVIHSQAAFPGLSPPQLEAAPLPLSTPTSSPPKQLYHKQAQSTESSAPVSMEHSLPPQSSLTSFFDSIHVETAGGVYKYKCKLCQNMFKIRNSLYEHMNSHLGRRPHVCSHCGDSFAHHSSLHNHVRNKHVTMTSEEREAARRHHCGGCGRKFRFPSELERHFKTNPDHDTKTLEETSE